MGTVHGPVPLFLAFWTRFEWRVGIRASSSPMPILTTFKTQTLWSSSLRGQGNPRADSEAGQMALAGIWYLCLRAFSSLSWYTLKATLKTSSLQTPKLNPNVRGVLGKNVVSCLPSGFSGSRIVYCKVCVRQFPELSPEAYHSSLRAAL